MGVYPIMTSLWSSLFTRNASQSFSITKVNISKLYVFAESTLSFPLFLQSVISTFVHFVKSVQRCIALMCACAYHYELNQNLFIFIVLKYLCVCKQKSVMCDVWFMSSWAHVIVRLVFVLSIDVARNEMENICHFLISLLKRNLSKALFTECCKFRFWMSLVVFVVIFWTIRT